MRVKWTKRILYLILLGLLSVLLFVNWNKNRDLKNEYLGLKQESDSLKNRLGFHLNIMELDQSLLLFNEIDSIRSIFQNLYSATSDSIHLNTINLRLQLLDSIKVSFIGYEDNSLTLDQQIQQKNRTIGYLRMQLEETEKNRNQMQEDFQNELSKTQGKLQLNENELKKQDKIKIITFTSSKGITVHYLGEVDQGKAQGNGMGIWATGSKYQGEWLNNMRHGNGTFQWADGDKYEGEYQNDLRNGFGIYYFKSGEKYEGEWIDDKRNGNGKLFDKDSNVRFEGDWLDDKPQVK